MLRFLLKKNAFCVLFFMSLTEITLFPSTLAAETTVVSTTAPSPTPAVATATPEPTPTPIGKAQTNSLRREFKRAQENEMRALVHRQEFELKELKASQKASFKDWWNQKKEERRIFFKAHPKGKDQREFMGKLISERKAREQSDRAELKNRKSEFRSKQDSIRQDQVQKSVEFEKSIQKNQMPSPALWPSANP